MDFTKINLLSYIPAYDKSFNKYLKDKSIAKYVSFTKWDSTLIFYDKEFIGFCKVITCDEEIYIAIIEKYRNKKDATYVITILTNNIFQNDTKCPHIHLSVNKENISSIKLA